MDPSVRCRLFATVGQRPSEPSRDELQVHLINDAATPLERATLTRIGFEWGDFGNYTEPNITIGPLSPGECMQIWRDDDSSPELRLDAWLTLHWADLKQDVLFEFPRLYMHWENLVWIPERGARGKIATPQIL